MRADVDMIIMCFGIVFFNLRLPIQCCLQSNLQSISSDSVLEVVLGLSAIKECLLYVGVELLLLKDQFVTFVIVESDVAEIVFEA